MTPNTVSNTINTKQACEREENPPYHEVEIKNYKGERAI